LARKRSRVEIGVPGCEKQSCKEMTSCEEARHYLEQCGLTRLDGDRDGVPCEQLCGATDP